MENYINDDLDVELFITTMELFTVHVNISAPRFTASTIFQQITVIAGTVVQVSYTWQLRMVDTALDAKALHIIGDGTVVVYGVNKAQYSNDAFLGLPVNILGKEYFAVTYYPDSRQQPHFLIIGVEDGTSVSITFPSVMTGSAVTYNSVNYNAGDTLTATVNRFDTFQVANTNGGDMTGARITSDKVIAVCTGNMRTSIGSGSSSDHLVEMLYPVERWGEEYVTIPTPDRTVGDKFKFVASEGSTTVQITGGHTASFTLSNAGDSRTEDISSSAYCRIVANKAIIVIQYVLSQQSNSEESDPAMMIIPAINQFSYTYTFSTPTYSIAGQSYISYLMIVIKDADKGGLLLDGASISPTLTSISGTVYVGGYVNVAEGTHTIEHTSRIVFFGAYLYGRAKWETYSFPVGMRLGLINSVSMFLNPTVSIYFT